MRSRRFFLVVSRRCALAAVTLTACLVLMLPVPSAVATEAAWQELRSGGIVLFRHALAPGTGDPAAFDVDDCATQRNLNATGRADARRIGEVFRREGIAVGKVLSSQWCRCLETAELAFPGAVTEEPAFNSFFENRSAGPAQTRTAAQILTDWQGPGTLVVVTHQVNITALTGVFPSSGEGIVIRMEDGAPVLVGRLDIPGS